MILLSAILGFIGIFAEIIIFFRIQKRFRQWSVNIPFILHCTILILCVAIGYSQAYGGINYAIAYTDPTTKTPGSVVGFPFFVVFFGTNGGDFFSNVLYLPAMIGNAIFWGMLPYLLVNVFYWRHFKRLHNHATEQENPSPSSEE